MVQYSDQGKKDPEAVGYAGKGAQNKRTEVRGRKQRQVRGTERELKAGHGNPRTGFALFGHPLHAVSARVVVGVVQGL